MRLITLENGLRIFFDFQPSLRSATLGVWVASGSRNETEKTSGISHFIEHIVFKGSKTRSAFEIAEGMDSIGASLNAYTTKEYTFFYTRSLDYQLLPAADIFFDMLKNPRLDENDIETEKGVIFEEIAMCGDDPNDVCTEANENAIFGSDGLKREILGTRESVGSFKKADFQEHMNRFYVPERTVIGVSGNFDEEKILDVIKSFYENDKNTGYSLTEEKTPFEKKFTVKSREFEQVHMLLSFPGVGIEHDELYSLELALFILGTGSSSRLNRRLREQLGLVYSVDSWLGRYLGGGYIAVGMSLSPKSEEKALSETCEIIKDFPASITESELLKAKEKLTASLIMSREQPRSKFASNGYTLLMLSKFIDDDYIINAVRSVTLERIRETAKKFLNLNNAAFTAVGKTRDADFYRAIIEKTAKTEK